MKCNICGRIDREHMMRDAIIRVWLDDKIDHKIMPFPVMKLKEFISR